MWKFYIDVFRLFECFMESAPQLVLQIYILIKDPHAIRLMDDGNRFVEGKIYQESCESCPAWFFSEMAVFQALFQELIVGIINELRFRFFYFYGYKDHPI